MLKIMRKHAGWGLKVVLGVIIVTFVFFFGYTKIREQSREATAIQVGPDEISFSQYRFFYENQYERLKTSFKDAEMPDFLIKNIQESARQQLVQRTLIKQFANSLGVKVTDKELAEFIVKEKDFDPVEYKNFLNSFYYRNGFSYEDLVREDLLIQKFQNWAQKMERPTSNAEPGTPNIEWTFETAALEGEEKQSLAKTIQETWGQGKEAAPLLKKNKIQTDKVGPIAIKNRRQLFNGQLTLEEYTSLFSLDKPKSAPANPFVKEKRFFVVRLLEKKSSPEKKAGADGLPQTRLIDVWFRKFADKTKIQSFIKSDEL